MRDLAPEPCGCEWHSRPCAEGDREYWLVQCSHHMLRSRLLDELRTELHRLRAIAGGQSDPGDRPNPYEPRTFRK